MQTARKNAVGPDAGGWDKFRRDLAKAGAGSIRYIELGEHIVGF
jgi:hypothetical protein